MEPPYVSRLVRVFLSLGALSFGALVMGASLIAVRPVSSTTDPATARTLYFGQAILPDHVLYPGLMIADRVKLELSDPEERIYVQVNYASRRLDSTRALLERDNIPRATDTLTKSQKYVITAAHEALQPGISPEIRSYVLKALEYHDHQVEQLLPAFEGSNQQAITQLRQESKSLQERLKH